MTDPWSDLLSRLERKEAELLTWGLVDGSFTRSEIEQHAKDLLEETTYEDDQVTAPDLVNELVARAVLLQDPFSPSRFRTRMAETVRLAAQLRQIFPNGDNAWRTAPRLVADYRLGIGARRYPQRDLTVERFIERVSEGQVLPTPVREALKALLERGPNFKYSAFQADATRQALGDVLSQRNSGLVVAAGTGSGKTLAFYLPALAWAASAKDSLSWTKILAIYPRIELIRDQMQAAYRECRRLDVTLAGRRSEKLTIGALFSDVPNTAASVRQLKSWESTYGGFVCPLLKCPHCGNGRLRWPESDRIQGKERLECMNPQCQGTLESDEIVLTRNRMKASPPDILFMTAEMLNKEMSNDWNRHLFGLGRVPASKRPRFLLLDEIHVNQGISGAQMAMLIRRWRDAVSVPITVVGLSATLVDARGFFSQLTGVHDYAVTEVSPHEDDLFEEGMQYSLALRGDPTSGTSLLSTSIQTAMLMSRVLDPKARPQRSAGMYGQRTYAFTDQLDSVNRLYWDLSHAEGWKKPDRPMARHPRSLAAMRSPHRDAHSERYDAGQSWDAVVEIGHELKDVSQQTVSQTSSLAPGVTGSDIVIATASLEVGYDDPDAGAVIQHKAPRSAAQFIQRKGRAGRARGMRPWTVIVLSDYGRDRLAYMTFESLFDPKLERQVLPLSNRYVLRMQAGFATLEWMGEQLRRLSPNKGSAWDDAARPPRQGEPRDRERQQKMLTIVDQVLTDERARRDLAGHISRSLSLGLDEVAALLWESPRAILTEMLPTLRRRLDSEWRTIDGGNDMTRRTPLPDFLPQNLFSDLLVPEVEVVIPLGGAQDPKSDSLGVVAALTEFTPGRASKRYAVEYRSLAHWIPVGDAGNAVLQDGIASTDVGPYIEGEVAGTFGFRDASGAMAEVECLRPYRAMLDLLPPDVGDSTMARPNWKTQVVRRTEPLASEMPTPSAWQNLIDSLTFHLHVDGHQVNVRRFYASVTLDLKRRDGTGDRSEVRLIQSQGGPEDGAVPVALGFDLDVDGIRIVTRHEDINRRLQHLSAPARRGSRSAWFHWQVLESDDLPLTLNPFQRRWMALLALGTLCRTAVDDECDLATAHLRLGDRDWRDDLRHALNVIVGVRTTDGADEHEFATDVDPDDQGRLYQALHEAINDPDTADALYRLLGCLTDDQLTSSDFQQWQYRRTLGTLAGAFVGAMARIDTQIDPDALVVDLDPGPSDPTAETNGDHEFWITETIPGGGGVLEQFRFTYLRDPRRFWRIVMGLLQMSDSETVDRELCQLLDRSQGSPLADLLLNVRSAYTSGHERLRGTVRALHEEMNRQGIVTTSSVNSAVSHRILRPGTSPNTDKALQRIIKEWDELQHRFDIDIDVHIVAYLLSGQSWYDGVLNRRESVPGVPDEQLRYNSLLGILWLRHSSARSNGLDYSNRYTTATPTDRLLVLTALDSTSFSVRIDDPNWREVVTKSLEERGTVELVSPLGANQQMHACLLDLLQRPCEIGFMLLYPRLVRAVRSPEGISVTLELRESLQ